MAIGYDIEMGDSSCKQCITIVGYFLLESSNVEVLKVFGTMDVTLFVSCVFSQGGKSSLREGLDFEIISDGGDNDLHRFWGRSNM